MLSGVFEEDCSIKKKKYSTVDYMPGGLSMTLLLPKMCASLPAECICVKMYRTCGNVLRSGLKFPPNVLKGQTSQ